MLLAGSGRMTNPVYVQDLAIWLPHLVADHDTGFCRDRGHCFGAHVRLPAKHQDSRGITQVHLLPPAYAGGGSLPHPGRMLPRKAIHGEGVPG